MSAEFLTVLVMFLGSNGLYAWWARTASKERRSIINACIARTPQEFDYLENEPAASRRKRQAANVQPPIGL